MTKRDLVREKLSRFGALGFLLVLAGLALAGPYGLLAWGENNALLKQRQDRIATLEAERAELSNLVTQLDPDLAAELIRRNLNVIHPDEYVIELKPER